MTGLRSPDGGPVNWLTYSVCFPRRIELSDLDGFVEVGGQFLVIERKKDTPNPDNYRFGQEASHARLSAQPQFTYIAEIVHADGSRTWRIARPRWVTAWRRLTEAEAVEWLTAWAKWADGAHQPPTREPGVATSAPKAYALAVQRWPFDPWAT